MPNLDLPADIVLDECTAYDRANNVVTFSRLVFDAAAGAFIQRVHYLLPGGTIGSINVQPSGAIMELEDALFSSDTATIDLGAALLGRRGEKVMERLAG